MLGIIVQLAISLLIVWLYEKNDLRVLGFYPTKKRWIDFILFLMVTALCCTSGFLLKMYFANEQWKVNPKVNTRLILDGVWWNIKSVLFEELIFRGVILYILIKKAGYNKAIIISAIAFGIYHWFSFNIIGNVTQMVIMFLMTGTMGLLLAYGYAKTMSLYIPSAIHLGWNITQGFIFSNGPIGDGVLKMVNPTPFRTDSYLTFIIVFVVPVASTFVINFLLLKKKTQIDPSIYKKRQTVLQTPEEIL